MTLFKFKKTHLIWLLMAALIASGMPVPAQDMPRFFESLGDIPRMEGLEELKEQTLVYDKPEGRFVEMMALSQAAGSEASVLAYYQESLAQLGWQRLEERSFVRGDEQLVLSFESLDRQNFVRFTLSPRGL